VPTLSREGALVPQEGPTGHDDVVRGMAELGGVLLSEQTLDDLLELIVSLARSSLGGADGVSVSLLEAGVPITTNSSDDVVRELDGVQYASDEGPCIDAMKTGTQVQVALAEETDRYPHFSPAAMQRFMTGILSTPLKVLEETTGALNVYSASVARFGEEDADIAGRFAAQASILLANAAAYAAAVRKSDQLQLALQSRDLIGQAKGILMERNRCSAEEAFDMLRRTSQHANRKLTSVAEEVVESHGGGHDDSS